MQTNNQKGNEVGGEDRPAMGIGDWSSPNWSSLREESFRQNPSSTVLCIGAKIIIGWEGLGEEDAGDGVAEVADCESSSAMDLVEEEEESRDAAQAPNLDAFIIVYYLFTTP